RPQRFDVHRRRLRRLAAVALQVSLKPVTRVWQMLKRLSIVPLLLLALGLAACGGSSGGGGSESEPPSLASIEKCLEAGKAEVSKGKSNPDEIVGKMPDKGLIIAFTFVHGQEGEEA